MKRILKLLFMAVASVGVMSACGGNDTPPDPTPQRGPLVLTSDKSSFTADGEDVVTFTVTQGGVDVTEDCNICCQALCLADNKYSTTDPGVYTFYAYFTLEENDPDHEISNTLDVTAEEPDGGTQADYDDPFDAARTPHKNVAYFVYTATWCGPCYTFKENSLKDFMPAHAGEFVLVNVYIQSAPEVTYLYGSKLTTGLNADGRFEREGEPDLFIEWKEGGKGVDKSLNGLNTAQAKYVAVQPKTAIKVRTSIDGDRLTVTPTMGAKEAGTYYFGAFLVEDNIIAQQMHGTEYIPNFNHTNVARDLATEFFGSHPKTIAAGEEAYHNYRFTLLPTWNIANLSAVVYTLYEVDGHNVIDNIVKVPIGTPTGYKYAE